MEMLPWVPPTFAELKLSVLIQTVARHSEPTGRKILCVADADAASGATGTYYDEKGNPMTGSQQVRDPEFQQRVVAETRALLATTPLLREQA